MRYNKSENVLHYVSNIFEVINFEVVVFLNIVIYLNREIRTVVRVVKVYKHFIK